MVLYYILYIKSYLYTRNALLAIQLMKFHKGNAINYPQLIDNSDSIFLMNERIWLMLNKISCIRAFANHVIQYFNSVILLSPILFSLRLLSTIQLANSYDIVVCYSTQTTQTINPVLLMIRRYKRIIESKLHMCAAASNGMLRETDTVDARIINSRLELMMP